MGLVALLCCAVLCMPLSAQVTELWQFFLVRMLTGVSVGGCFPLVFSLLGDLFPVTQRAAMSSIIQIAIGGGIGGGQVSGRCILQWQPASWAVG
jgi:MFS family permease